MASDSSSTPPGEPATVAPAPPRPVRVWPGLFLVAVFWTFWSAIVFAGLPISTTFMSRAGAWALLTLSFPIWWLTNRTIRLSDRLWTFAVLVVGGAAAIALSDKSLGAFGVLFFGVPVVFTAWAIWLLVARRQSPQIVRAGMIVTICLVGSSRVDLQACKLEYSIVSPK